MSGKAGTPIVDLTGSPHRTLRGVDLQAVRWTGGFWADRVKQAIDVTLPHLWALASDPGAGHALTNLQIAAGLEQGEFAGTHWQDAWVYKCIEASAFAFALTGSSELDEQMDDAIDAIVRAQQPDGYIATQTIVRGWPRYQNINHHELYTMGHLLQAACAHHRATGKANFLDVARKVGDHMHETFKDRPVELAHFGFNPSQIMGLVELYRTTGEERYLQAAQTFIDMRGAVPGGSDQNQDHVPLREETQAVGHSVLATYLYAGATDMYMETGEDALLEALSRIWHDITERKMYVNGGVAALHRGLSIRNDDVHEAFGAAYHLPGATAYNETCAQIGNMMWNYRMLCATGDARYADIMELNLYNSVISGITLEGNGFWYTNPLRWYGKDHELLSNDLLEANQPSSSGYICCPTNVLRTLTSAHGYAYSATDDAVYVNLYGSNTFEGALGSGSRLRIEQRTDYPWDGRVRIMIERAPGERFALMLRIPAWAQEASAKLNGKPQRMKCVPGTYATMRRKWSAGDVVELDLPMGVRMIESNPRVEHTRNQLAVARGPLVYCLEAVDLPADVKLDQIRLPRCAQLVPKHEPGLLGGLTVLEGLALAVEREDWDDGLYRVCRPPARREVPVRLIPYYAWRNRGICEMTVWIPVAG